MSLIDKLKQTKKIGKRAFLAGTLVGALAVSGCSGYRDNNNS